MKKVLTKNRLPWLCCLSFALIWNSEHPQLAWGGTGDECPDFPVLLALGDKECGPSRQKDFEKAVVSARHTLKKYTEKGDPFSSATAEGNLGAALMLLGEHEGGAAGVTHLEDAISAFRAAQSVYRGDRTEDTWVRWAILQNSLGNTLQVLGTREGNTERLKEAVNIYEETLDEWMTPDPPIDLRGLSLVDRAVMQNNLGLALVALGERENGTESLKRALEVYAEALKVSRKEEEAQHHVAETIGIPVQWTGGAHFIDMLKANLAHARALLENKQLATPQTQDHQSQSPAGPDEMQHKLVPQGVISQRYHDFYRETNESKMIGEMNKGTEDFSDLAAAERAGEPETRSLVLQGLNSENTGIQAAMIFMAEVGRDANAAEHFVRLLKSTDANVREASAEAIGELGDSRYEKYLLEAAAIREENPVVLAAIARSLGYIGSTSSRDVLVKLLDYGDSNVQETAAWALSYLQDKTVSPNLYRTMSDEKTAPGVRLATALSLVRLGDERGYAFTASKVGSSDVETRRIAVMGLGLTGDPQYAPTLRQKLEDFNENVDVRFMAAWGLGLLGGRDATDSLLSRLKDDYEGRTLRAGAIRLLLNTKEPEALDGILGYFNRMPYSLKLLAIDCLGDVEDKRATLLLGRILSNTSDKNPLSEDLRLSAAASLSRGGDPVAMMYLVGSGKVKYMREALQELLKAQK